MKRFLKKMNRGVLLAAVLIIGVMIFTMVDQWQFTSEKPAVEQELRDYFASEFELMQEGQITPEKVKVNLNRYWMQENAGNRSGWSKDDTIANLDYYLGEFPEMKAAIEKVTGQISNISIKKNGPAGAIATINYRCSITYKGSQVLYIPAGYIYWTNGSRGTTEYVANLECTVVLKLQRRDGKWKIWAAQYEYLNETYSE